MPGITFNFEPSPWNENKSSGECYEGMNSLSNLQNMKKYKDRTKVIVHVKIIEPPEETLLRHNQWNSASTQSQVRGRQIIE